MMNWDQDHPGRGDIEMMDAVFARIGEHLTTLTECANTLDGTVGQMLQEWTGSAAEAWAATAGAVGTDIRAFEQLVRTTVQTCGAYAAAVRSIDSRAAIAAEDHSDATRALTGAQTRLREAQESETGDDTERLIAYAAVKRAEEGQRVARAVLDGLVWERESADAAMLAALQQHVPSGWAGAGPLASRLPATAFDRGHEGLATWIASLPEGAEGDAALHWMLEQLSQDDFDALLAAHPEIAVRLVSADTSEAFRARFPELDAALAVTDPMERIPAVAAACAGMSEDDLTVLARCYPGMVHNLDGVPLPTRIAANRVAISAELVASRNALSAMEDLVAGQNDGPTPLQQSLLNAWRTAIDWYEELLYGDVDVVNAFGEVSKGVGHQVVAFDPGAGKFGELIGYAGAPDIGVLVGGTGTNLATMDGQAARAWDFVLGAPGLAMITYIGGPMPQDLIQAADSAWAKNVAPSLASFVNGVKAVTGATVTVAGHSYGGSVVGRAEVEGMIADRILHIESAGGGPGVDSISDYAAPDTPRYSMTAPGDVIGSIQGMSLGTTLGHGQDPDTMEGVTRLETGRVNSEDPYSALLQGIDSHSGVFGQNGEDEKPDAWQNMLSVMTGGNVTVWTEASFSATVQSNGTTSELVYPMEDPTYQPPIEAVR